MESRDIGFVLSVPYIHKWYSLLDRGTAESPAAILLIQLKGQTRNRFYSKYPDSLVYSNSVNPDQTAPAGAVCSGSALFATGSLHCAHLIKHQHKQTR